MGLLWRAAEDVRARGDELSAAGLFAPPAGGALDDIAMPLGIAIAALAFTVSVGLCGCLSAQFTADCLGRSRRPVGRIVTLVVVTGAGVIGWFVGAPLLALWLAGLYLLPLVLLLARASAGSPDRRRAGGIWAGVLVLLLATISTVESGDLRRFRDGILSTDAGEAFVNAYYRHAMLAAEPIKAPAQRHYLTWSASGTQPPSWFRCMRAPWLLLQIETLGRADIEVRSATGSGVVLGNPRQRDSASHRVDRGEAGDRIEAVMQEADPAGFRRIVAVGFLVGGPGTVAWALACLVGLRGGNWRTVTICGVLGLTVVVLLPADDGADIRARIDGTGPERMRAAAAGAVEPEKLRQVARADDLLPVRARALAAWVRQAPDLEEAARQVAAGATWYEQWYGYHALVGRDWHPDTDRCVVGSRSGKP